jgi:hypothetical protein
MDYFVTFWFIMSIPMFLIAASLNWYFLPFLPAICYFALLAIGPLDRFGKIAIVVFLVVNLAAIIYHTNDLKQAYHEESEVGRFLAGKENVAFIGGYAPGAFTYKILEEEKMYGKGNSLDFGWVEGVGMSKEMYDVFVSDYHSDKFPVLENEYNTMFSRAALYRRVTNISNFSYLVIMYPPSTFVMPNVQVPVFNVSGISVYKVG